MSLYQIAVLSTHLRFCACIARLRYSALELKGMRAKIFIAGHSWDEVVRRRECSASATHHLPTTAYRGRLALRLPWPLCPNGVSVVDCSPGTGTAWLSMGTMQNVNRVLSFINPWAL